MAWLTINADDFGFTEGVTEGIHRAMAEGIVTSTAAMACVEGAENNLALWASRTPGAIGAHLQLTDGQPVLPAAQVPTLVNEEGKFYAKGQLPWNLSPAEVLAEWKAQVKRLQQWGLTVTYLDSHHHVHLGTQLLPVMVQLASELGLPVRGGAPSTVKMLRYKGVSTPDVTLFNFFGDDLSWSRLVEILEAALTKYGSDAVIELSCHPGYSSSLLEKLSHYTVQRERELSVFLQPGARQELERLGFHLISMNEVGRLRPARAGKTTAL